jgi:hypothetical protein
VFGLKERKSQAKNKKLWKRMNEFGKTVVIKKTSMIARALHGSIFFFNIIYMLIFIYILLIVLVFYQKKLLIILV